MKKYFFIFILIPFLVTQIIPLGNVYNLGNLVSGDTITVYFAETLTPATLFDSDGGNQISNPITVGSNGQYNFYVDNGVYDFEMAGNGFTTYKVENVKILDPRKLNDNEKLVFGTNNNMKLFWDGLVKFKFNDAWDKDVLQYITLGEQFGGWRFIQKRNWNDPTQQPLIDFWQLGTGENCIRWHHKNSESDIIHEIGDATSDHADWLLGNPVKSSGYPFALFHDIRGLTMAFDEKTLNVLFTKQFGIAQNWKYDIKARESVNTNRRLSLDQDTRAFSEEYIGYVNTTSWVTIKTLTPSVTNGIYTRGYIEAQIGGHTSGVNNGTVFSRWYFDINNGNISVGNMGLNSSGSSPQFRLNVNGNAIEMQIKSCDGTNIFHGTYKLNIFAPVDWAGQLYYSID